MRAQSEHAVKNRNYRDLQSTISGRVLNCKNKWQEWKQQSSRDVLQDAARQKHKPICQHELCI